MKKDEAMAFIGNGFDIALHFNTRYSDFYANSVKLKQLANNGNTLCKHIINNIKGTLWSDLECGLHQYSIELTQKYGKGNRCVANRYEKEFNELREALFDYLLKEVQNQVEAVNGVLPIFLLWEKLNVQYVTFNYTILLAGQINDRRILNKDDSVNTQYLIFQHGSTYNSKDACNRKPSDIVLGIDDSQVVEDLHGFLYKSNQQAFSFEQLKQYIDSKQIYIVYGCSMGASDKRYFEHLFNKNQCGKIYMIYAYGEDKIKQITDRVSSFVGKADWSKFIKSNEVNFINSENVSDAQKKTKSIIDSL